MGFDYNTQRSKLILPEYGRHVQKMVEYLMTIEDREKRNRLAQVVVNVMGNINPQLRDTNEFKHKLWDHLFIISNFQLDIDCPYEKPTPKKFQEKPRPIPYPQGNIKYRYYGRYTEEMVKKIADMPEGKEKEELIKAIANHMKKLYLTWNKDSVDDEIIIRDLYDMSEGKINAQGLKLSDPKDLIKKHKKQQQNQKRNK